MTCMLIDDEPLAIEIIESHLSKIDGVEIIGKFSSAVKAFSEVQALQPDLLFLDIQMPQLTGLDFLKTLQKPPMVIFTTAYREYALEGYELDVIDYLVKPISFPRFLKAVSKAMRQKELTTPAPKETPAFQLANTSQKAAGNSPAFVYLKVGKMMEKVVLEDILYIESLKNYVKVFTKEKQLVTYHTLSQMEEMLPQADFLRIHRSYMIALCNVKRFSATHVEIGGHELPIGGLYKQGVLERLGA